MKGILKALAIATIMASCSETQEPEILQEEQLATIRFSITAEDAKCFYDNNLTEFEAEIPADGRKASAKFVHQGDYYVSEVMIPSSEKELVTVSLTIRDKKQSNTVSIENFPLEPDSATEVDFSAFTAEGKINVSIDAGFYGDKNLTI